MTRPSEAPALSRRSFLKAGGAGLLAIQILPNGLVTGTAWAQMPRSLKAETFATLVQVSRDLYPHDLIEDKHYAAAVNVLDEAARASEQDLKFLEDGVIALDNAAQAKHGSEYVNIRAEPDRAALLREAEGSEFVQKLRTNLVTGLYNNHELWPILNYEGESASKGGYINRGFNDLDWL